ncbi:MAG: hypothetical protein K0U36_00750 [Alphaproteobacteria bacterium]|nr:hypothetical protein [Alphaproteobacteria bacterium]
MSFLALLRLLSAPLPYPLPALCPVALPRCLLFAPLPYPVALPVACSLPYCPDRCLLPAL